MIRTTVSALLVFLFAMFQLSTGMARAQPAPAGPAFLVPSTLGEAVESADLAVASDGRAAVLWQLRLGDGSTRIKVRAFDSETVRPVHRIALGQLVELGGIAPLGDGFVAVYTDGGIFARRIDRDGRPRGAPETLAPEGKPFVGPSVPSAPCGDGQGRALVAWLEGESVWGRFLDAGGEGGDGAFEISDGPLGFFTRPVVTCAPGAGFAVVWHWYTYRNQEERVYFRRYSAEGEALDARPRVVSRNVRGSQVAAALAEDGRLAVVWRDRESLLTTRCFDRRGRPEGDPAAIDPSPIPSYDTALEVVSRGDGSFLAIFGVLTQDETSPPRRGIVGRYFDGFGQPIGEAFELASVWGHLRGLTAGVDASGDLGLAWWGPSNGFDPSLFAQRFGVSEAGRIVFHVPRAAIGEGDGPLELWALRVGGSAGALSERWSTVAGGARVNSDFIHASGTVDFADGESRPRRLEIEIVNDERREDVESLRVVWGDPPLPGALGVGVEIHDDDGSPPLVFDGPPRQVDTAEPTLDPLLSDRSVDVAFLPGGEWIAAWASFDREVYTRRYAFGGEPLGAPERAPIPAPELALSPPRLTVSPAGDVALVWQATPEFRHLPTSDTYLWLRPAGASGWARRVEVLHRALYYVTSRSRRPGVAWATNGELLVAGVYAGLEDRSGRMIEVEFDPSGNPSAVYERELPFLPESFSPPELATLPGGPTLALRRIDQDGDGPGVAALRLPAAGFPRGPLEIVNIDVTGRQDQIAFTAIGANRAFALWRFEDHRTGRSDLRGLFVDGEGRPLGSEIFIEPARRGTLSRPRLAVAGECLLAVWEYREPGTDRGEIRARLLNTEGRALGPTFEIPAGEGPRRYPVVTGDDRDDFIVAWQEDLGGGYSAHFAERLRVPYSCVLGESTQ